MINVPSDWLGEQQAKLRRAIADLEAFSRDVPPEQRDAVERVMADLRETLRRELDLLGPLP
jgi:hypothetical protein